MKPYLVHMNSVYFQNYITGEVSFLWVSLTPQFQICVKHNAKLRHFMPWLFLLASIAKAVTVFTSFHHYNFTMYKVFTSLFLKECSVLLAVCSVANKTFTYVRNVEGKHGIMLEAIESCD